MTLNKMMIIGNLGADPELRYTPGGKAVTNLRVAVNNRHRGQDGEWQEETQWFRVELWDQAAERAAEQFRKGNRYSPRASCGSVNSRAMTARSALRWRFGLPASSLSSAAIRARRSVSVRQPVMRRRQPSRGALQPRPARAPRRRVWTLTIFRSESPED